MLKICVAATLKYSNDALRSLIGPLGVLKRKIEEETGLFILRLLNFIANQGYLHNRMSSFVILLICQLKYTLELLEGSVLA